MNFSSSAPRDACRCGRHAREAAASTRSRRLRMDNPAEVVADVDAARWPVVACTLPHPPTATPPRQNATVETEPRLSTRGGFGHREPAPACARVIDAEPHERAQDKARSINSAAAVKHEARARRPDRRWRARGVAASSMSPSSPASLILTLMNQPSSSADELTRSGVSSSAPLISTTCRGGPYTSSSGLDRLHGPEGLALLDLVADLGEVDEHDVAERVRRVVRDADRRPRAGRRPWRTRGSPRRTCGRATGDVEVVFCDHGGSLCPFGGGNTSLEASRKPRRRRWFCKQRFCLACAEPAAAFRHAPHHEGPRAASALRVTRNET